MGFCVYILASKPHGLLYVGRTSDLRRRLWQHRTKALPGHTAENDISTLVYFEVHETLEPACRRERTLKRRRREWKFNLIERQNRHWLDLSAEWFAE